MAESFFFDLPCSLHPGLFKSKIKSSYACEKTAKSHLNHHSSNHITNVSANYYRTGRPRGIRRLVLEF